MSTRLCYLAVFCLVHCTLLGQGNSDTSVFIKFPGYTTRLSKKARLTLDSVAEVMLKHPAYFCIVRGENDGSENVKLEVAQFDRIDAATKYLLKKQSAFKDRVIFSHAMGEKDDGITVSLTMEKWEGPSAVPAPHPNLRKKIPRDTLR